MSATKSVNSARSYLYRSGLAAALAMILAGAFLWWSPARSLAADNSLLGGRITTSDKQAVSGIPIRAHRDGTNITVSVYTNGRGEYSFPAWSDLSPGSHSVAIALPDFEPVNQEGLTLTRGKTVRLDLTLQPRQPSLADATAAEIAMAEPGTDDQKFLLTQCDNCHTLQWALRKPHTKEEWVKIVRRMAGERQASRDTPGTRAFGQKQYIEPLADYLTTIRGPGSSDQIPFKVRPRPTGEESTRLVVTEYDLPRGGSHDLYTIRGDRRFVWPHDVMMDSNYAWYTDHFSYRLGRLDKRTGEAKEFPYTVPPGTARERMPAEGDGRAGDPGGGAHKIVFDPEKKVVFGAGGATARFDPATERFSVWPHGNAQFGMDPTGRVWFLHGPGDLQSVDPKTGDMKDYPISQRDGIYDMDTDSKGRSILNVFAGGTFGLYDPQTDKYTEYPTPTPGSGPRRGHLDANDRAWVGLYWAGRVGMFDPNTGEVQEYPLVPGSKPYGPPFPAPYTTAVDDKNQIVWASDFNSSRIYRLDMRNGKPTEFFMPAPYEVRDLEVDMTASRPTVWIPAYRPPSKLVKVQVW
jgi:streptogramin lyase